MCASWLDSKEVMMLSNYHEAKYAKVNHTMKVGSKEDFKCPLAIELCNKIMGGIDLTEQMANVYDLNRKSCKWWRKKKLLLPIDERSGQFMDCVLRTQTSKNSIS
ncbi:rho guanine nucleotide exchange factor 10-like protein [Trichonephila clavata]|uniref:Rho guanine nucleotide exchange factor 10-like protein n=1 Tax=Trichonephila clavata TaxID=2740835 RepID=A0A8X6H9D5_TRICU|nr:rho guanine nucleotide exchange factor 10-like protein [Trichonephila clavata]